MTQVPRIGALIMASALALLILPPAEARAAEPSGFPFPFSETRLDTGLRLVVVPMKGAEVLTIATVVRVGSRDETEKGLSGYAHLFEHMMFRGTTRYPEQVYNDVLKRLGADSNAFTDDDLTVYHITIPPSALAQVVEMEADRFQHLAFSEADYRKETGAVLGEYNKSASSPELIVEEQLRDAAFDRHTYKHSTLGFKADVLDMPNHVDHARAFFAKHYVPGNCTIVVAGAAEPKAVEALVRQHFGAWRKDRPRQPEVIRDAPQASERRRVVPWTSKTLPRVVVAWHIPEMTAPGADRAALALVAPMLWGPASPLYKRLVLEQAWVETLSVDALERRDPSLLIVTATVKNAAKIAEIERAIIAEADALASGRLDPVWLTDVQGSARATKSLVLAETSAVAFDLAKAIAVAGNVSFAAEWPAKLAAVTPQDAVAAAMRHLVASRRVVVRLAPNGPKAQGGGK